MKIREKGLTGKSAAARKDSIARRGFNAFREMAKAKDPSSSSTKPEKPEIRLEFMGSKILVQVEDGNGSVNKEDVPFVQGATLKFEGDVGDVSFNQIKVRATLYGLSTVLTLVTRILSGTALSASRTSNKTEGTPGDSWASTKNWRRKISNLSRTIAKSKERRSTGAFHQVPFRTSPSYHRA